MSEKPPRRCGRCRQPGHSWKTCPQNPDSTTRVEMPGGAAEHALRERLRPLLRACAREASFSDSLMLSCYVQGACDALSPEMGPMLAALREARP